MAHMEVWEESGYPPKCPQGLGRPTQSSDGGWVGLGGAPGHLGGIRRGLEAHPKVQVRNGGPGGFGRPTQSSGSCQEAHMEVWEE